MEYDDPPIFPGTFPPLGYLGELLRDFPDPWDVPVKQHRGGSICPKPLATPRCGIQNHYKLVKILQKSWHGVCHAIGSYNQP